MKELEEFNEEVSKNEMEESTETSEDYNEREILEQLSTDEDLECLIEERANEIVSQRVAKSKKRRKEKEKRRKEKLLFLVAIIIMVIAILKCISNFYPIPIYHFTDKVVERNLAHANAVIDSLPSNLPDMAWKGELPEFVKSDIKLMERINENLRIKYTYGDVIIYLEKKESYLNENNKNLILTFVTPNDEYYHFLNDFNQMSLYKDDDNLYWYMWSKYGEFQYVIINKQNVVEETVLSRYPEDIPIYVDDKCSFSLGNTIFVKEGNELSLWKQGTQLTTYSFEDGEIYSIPQGYSVLLTTDNKIYSIYTYSDVYENYIDVKYIDTVDDVKSITSSYFENNSLIFEFPEGVQYKFPIVQKKGEYYACLPENIKDYASYSLIQKDGLAYRYDKSNLNMQLVKLDESTFCSAKIYYDFVSDFHINEYVWLADITFKYNDTYYVCENVQIDGYDIKIQISDSEEEELSTTVYSVEQYWDAVEKIRNVYENYYTRRGD